MVVNRYSKSKKQTVMANLHPNTAKRIKMVCEITNKHYESGNNNKCYKEVWRRYVNPIYPMCYKTYLSYISRPLREIKEATGTHPHEYQHHNSSTKKRSNKP